MHISKSDFVIGKLNLPKSERVEGKDCISCANNSAKSSSRFWTDTYNWPQSTTLFCCVRSSSPAHMLSCA